MNKEIDLDYYHNFVNYHVHIVFKRHMRRVNYHYNPDTLTFNISAPILTSKKFILKYLDEYAEGLIKRSKAKPKPVVNDSVYIYGVLTPIVITNKNEIFSDHIELKKKEDLNKVMKKYFLIYLKERVNYYRELMDIDEYKIHVHNAKSRYGSNSKSKRSLAFALNLMHFHKDIIDSVIVHELAHDIEFNHSPAFYKVVYQYSPNYKALKKNLDECNYENK